MFFSVLLLVLVLVLVTNTPQASSFAPYTSSLRQVVSVSNPQNYYNHRDATTTTLSSSSSSASAAIDAVENDSSIGDDSHSVADNDNNSAASTSSTSTDTDTLPILFPALATPLNKLGFSTPTPIQSASAKRALSSENLLLIAPTGSGKTFSYMLPALEKVVVTQQQQQQQQQEKEQTQRQRTRRSTVLVVAPTRELGLQLMRDTNSILSNLGNNNSNSDDDDNNSSHSQSQSVLLAIQGVEMPTAQSLNAATVLIGTPKELIATLTKVNGASEFLAGNVLSTVILDEVDVLLPNSPKVKGGGAGNRNNDNRSSKGGGTGTKKGKITPQEERRRQVNKRKLLAAKRDGAEFSSDSKIVGPTETLLKLIAGRRSYTVTSSVDDNGTTSVSSYPYQILAGSATASRKTLDRLNKALRGAAMDVSSTVDAVWNGTVQPCRPVSLNSMIEDDSNQGSDGDGDAIHAVGKGDDHTIRTVTVPSQVKHQYIRLEKDKATKPGVVLAAVAKAASVLKTKRALLFLCGEFKKESTATAERRSAIRTNTNTNTISAVKPSRGRKRKGRQKTLLQKKSEATAASRAKQPARGLSASMACFGLEKLGIDAKPLHVALGLDADADDNDNDNGAKAEGGTTTTEEDKDGSSSGTALPQFLVTFEGAARGLHLDGVDTVFVVGRPSSAASYLHLAGRVGRSSTSENGEVIIKPGNVVSFCTAGSSKELNKWTKQVGGTDLEELILK